jgi:hypothetical protein
VEALFVAGLSALIALLVAGTVRRWRWTFWVVLVAFGFGILRVAASLLQLGGLIGATGPAWYEALQGAIGGAQFAIALAMWAGYRKGGAWANF